MIVCVCHRVSDRDIEREVRRGCDRFEDLQIDLGVATACGACTDCAFETFEGHRRQCGVAEVNRCVSAPVHFVTRTTSASETVRPG